MESEVIREGKRGRGGGLASHSLMPIMPRRTNMFSIWVHERHNAHTDAKVTHPKYDDDTRDAFDIYHRIYQICLIYTTEYTRYV